MKTSLSSRFPEIADELGPRIEAALLDAAEDVARNAKARVPVNTGTLRDEINVHKQGPGEYKVIGGDNLAFYGHLVEHGTRNAPPRPFLVPALEEARTPAVHAMIAVLRSL